MINIQNKAECVGCEACVQRCPQKCIVLQEDEEGFMYPHVEIETCINCGLCEKVCPVIHQGSARIPINSYAIINKNEAIRNSSSSGGVFTALAEFVLNRNGVVFGASFDESWSVAHTYVEEKSLLCRLRGAKYVQSSIGSTYIEVENFLKGGRYVLFSGLPCQVAGLKLFLRKEYENLITVDMFCHGVPSPGIWRKYLNEKIGCMGKKIERMSFRDKSTGWQTYSFSYTTKEKGIKQNFSELASRNYFMKGFLADLYLRPSCYSCPAKQLKSGSDLTIGDFWGIQHINAELDDNKGISAVLVNSDKGNHLLDTITGLMCERVSYDQITCFNPALIHSAKLSNKRRAFFLLVSSIGVVGAVKRSTKVSFVTKLKRKLIRYLGSLNCKILV